MNVLGWQLALAGYIAAFIVLVLFSASATAFLTKGGLWFPWRLFSVGVLGGTCTPSDINTSLMSGLKLLKKVAAIYTLCGSALILDRKWV